MVRSADPSTVATGPNAVAGSASSLAVRPAKCTSPANIKVMPDPPATAPGAAAGRAAVPLPAAGGPGGGGSFGDPAGVAVAGPGMPGAGETGPQAASAATRSRVRLASSALAGIGPG